MEENFIFWRENGQLVPYLLYEFFSTNGFGKYFLDEIKKKNTEAIIVKVDGNIVSPVNIGYLLEFTNDYIKTNVKDQSLQCNIMNSFHMKMSLFSDKNVKLLKTLPLNFISDTPTRGFLFFRNGVLEITRDAVQLKDYSDFDDYIWEKSIIPFNFTVVDFDTLKEKSDFMIFLGDLSVVADPEKSASRIDSLMSALGYLIHREKNPATTKAIIIMDMFVNGLANGGSGKTLLMNAIGKVRNLSIIDGKFYDQREWFSMSSVDLGSEVLLFDDVGLNFQFEQIFSLITTGMLVRRKHRDNQYLPFDKAPKIAITTNYAINGDSSSRRRRKMEFELTPTYSSEWSPREKFGRNFFDGWQEEDWNLFFNVMAHCLKVFLKNGLIESEGVNLHLTKLISKTCEEFVEWVDTAVQPEIQYGKKALYDKYLSAYPEYKTKVKQRDFTFWLRSWGEYKNYQITESHSGDVRTIIFDCTHAGEDSQEDSDSGNLEKDLLNKNIDEDKVYDE
jgi:hypothetical protein